MNSILQEVACPNCLSPIDIREHAQHINCGACSSQFILHGHLCPSCGRYSKQERQACGTCGTRLRRKCGKCRTSNWSGDEYCSQCGGMMDIFDLAAVNDQVSARQHREHHTAQVRAIKAELEATSAARMAQLEAIEVERQANLKREQAAQKKRDQTLLLTTLGIGSLGMLAFILFVIFGG